MTVYCCDICNKRIELKHKSKHLKTKSHKASSMSTNNRYCVKNPNFFEIEDILKKHADDYNEKVGFYIIICEWKLDFDSVLICVRSDNKMNISGFWVLRRHLMTKTVFFLRGEDISFLTYMK